MTSSNGGGKPLKAGALSSGRLHPKYLGAGLSRTGTSSLARACSILGMSVCHWSPETWGGVMHGEPVTRETFWADIMLDVPAALYWREFLEFFPDGKLIVTYRHEDSWWRSIKSEYDQRPFETQPDYSQRARLFAYGTTLLSEQIYRKRFRDHYAALRSHRIGALWMDITAGDGWYPLCRFLGVDMPSVPFPRENTGAEAVKALEGDLVAAASQIINAR